MNEILAYVLCGAVCFFNIFIMNFGPFPQHCGCKSFLKSEGLFSVHVKAFPFCIRNRTFSFLFKIQFSNLIRPRKSVRKSHHLVTFLLIRHVLNDR